MHKKSASLIKEMEAQDTGTFPSLVWNMYTKTAYNSDTIIFIFIFIIFRITESSHEVHSIPSKYPTYFSRRPRNLNDTKDWLFCVHPVFFLSSTKTTSIKSTVAPPPFCNNNGTLNKWNTFYHTVKCCKLKEQ